jgi:ribosomal protein S13
MISFFIRLRIIQGIRHLFRLPVRGQRSKTNANTQRHRSFITKTRL